MMTRAALSFVFAALTTTAIAGDNYLVYYGTETGQVLFGSKGVYVSRFNSSTGELTDPVLATEAGNPGFLAIHPSKKYLYTIGNVHGWHHKGISAYNVSLPDGKLSLINQASAVGVGPCHVSLDKTGHMAMIANYESGSIASYKVGKDGAVSDAVSFIQHEGHSVNRDRQEGPHAHSVNVSPDNRFAFACDLGLDKVFVYKIDPTAATMTAHGFGQMPLGTGPRHLAFHPNGKFVYVNGEMSMTVTTFAYDAHNGALTQLGTVSTLPPEDQHKIEKGGYSTAETVVHPNGKFVYVSNRAHDTIAVFACNPHTGALTLIQNAPAEGKIPRNFCLDPSGKWMIVAHKDSGSAALFKVDPETGKLAFTGTKVKLHGSICVRFLALD